MANTLIPRKSTIADKLPLPEQLAGGEVTVNWADQAWNGKHPGTGGIVPIGAPYLHSHDQLISLDRSRDLELTNAGAVAISDGTITTTLAPSSTVSRTLTLPDKSGTLATLDDDVIVKNSSDNSPVNAIRCMTQGEYDALGTYDPNTLYFIK